MVASKKLSKSKANFCYEFFHVTHGLGKIIKTDEQDFLWKKQTIQQHFIFKHKTETKSLRVQIFLIALSLFFDCTLHGIQTSLEDKALIDKNEMMFNESDPQVNVFAIMYLYVRMTWRQIIGPALCALILSNIITVPIVYE